MFITGNMKNYCKFMFFVDWSLQKIYQFTSFLIPPVDFFVCSYRIKNSKKLKFNQFFYQLAYKSILKLTIFQFSFF